MKMNLRKCALIPLYWSNHLNTRAVRLQLPPPPPSGVPAFFLFFFICTFAFATPHFLFSSFSFKSCFLRFVFHFLFLHLTFWPCVYPVQLRTSILVFLFYFWSPVSMPTKPVFLHCHDDVSCYAIQSCSLVLLRMRMCVCVAVAHKCHPVIAACVSLWLI